MKKSYFAAVVVILALTSMQAPGQSGILRPRHLKFTADQKTKDCVLNSVDTLFRGIDGGTVDSARISSDKRDLTIEILNSLKIDNTTKNDSAYLYKRQAINLYPVSATEYYVSIASIGSNSVDPPVLKTKFNMIAKIKDGKCVFDLPLTYQTKNWKIKRVGNITYHFADNINVKNARLFDRKNRIMAAKFGLKPEKLDFYLCDNYQEVLHLLGYEYDMESNGETRDGYGVVANTIFSVMHNEDFSHDLFHYYSAKVRKNKRNWFAEEGLAYCWGNAYWTKPTGEMITQKELVVELQKYLRNNPQTSLKELFDKQPIIFRYLDDGIGLRKILCSVICKEVERRHGMRGVMELLNCGVGADCFFNTTEKLINVSRANFDVEVRKLVEAFK